MEKRVKLRYNTLATSSGIFNIANPSKRNPDSNAKGVYIYSIFHPHYHKLQCESHSCLHNMSDTPKNLRTIDMKIFIHR